MELSFMQSLGMAFAGGVILNVMPCVLPVLTMKVFHLIEHSHDSEASHRKHGVAYLGGVMVTFAAFASIVVGLREAGELVGWGMQFQNPSFVAVLIAIIFAFGLNALGVFEISVSMHGGESRGGYLDSFVNGIVASIMSTPCSAPFLGSAAAFALGADVAAWQTFVVFLVIGFGLASPFVLVSFVPALGRALPKPGMWMETFKQLMGFSLLAAAVWLYGVFMAQVSMDSARGFLWFLLVLGVLLWAVQHFGGPIHGAARRYAVRVGALVLSVVSGMQLISFDPPDRGETTVDPNAVVVDDHINWQPFSPDLIERTLALNRPIFVDFTADWCANCKTNERLFIEVPAIRELLVETQIMPMQVDMTTEEDDELQWLSDLGRAGLPAYVIYFPDGTRDLLPVAITTELLSERLRAASERFPPSSFLAAGAADAACAPAPDAAAEPATPGTDEATDPAPEATVAIEEPAAPADLDPTAAPAVEETVPAE